MCEIREAKFQSSLGTDWPTPVDDLKVQLMGDQAGQRNRFKFKQSMGINKPVNTCKQSL